MEWDLVERMEEERKRLGWMLKETGGHPATTPILVNTIEFMIERIGYWQSEVIRIARENETLKRQANEVKS